MNTHRSDDQHFGDILILSSPMFSVYAKPHVSQHATANLLLWVSCKPQWQPRIQGHQVEPDDTWLMDFNFGPGCLRLSSILLSILLIVHPKIESNTLHNESLCQLRHSENESLLSFWQTSLWRCAKALWRGSTTVAPVNLQHLQSFLPWALFLSLKGLQHLKRQPNPGRWSWCGWNYISTCLPFTHTMLHLHQHYPVASCFPVLGHSRQKTQL